MIDIDGNILNKILENQTQEHIKDVLTMLKLASFQRCSGGLTNANE